MTSMARLVSVVAFTVTAIIVFNVTLVTADQKLEAICVLEPGPPASPVMGVITLTQKCPGSPVHITGSISGLPPDSVHGIHIHRAGDLSNKTNRCASTGPHYNPFNTTHGTPSNPPKERHVGDLGNVQSDAEGVAKVDKTDPDNLIKLCGSYSVVGRAIVVHMSRDDLGTDAGQSKTNGNSGTPVACCVIGYTKNSPDALHCPPVQAPTPAYDPY